MSTIETIIVGGGPAGASAACRLAAAGHEVLLFERTSGSHHKVCGEFLSIETQAILHDLGIDPTALNAVSVDRVTIHVGRRQVTAPLPFRALSVSRQVLDQALLDRAGAAGAQVRRGVAVQGVARDDGVWAARCDDGRILHARNLVLATGKHGLRGIGDGRDGSLVGLKMHLRLPDRSRSTLERHVNLFMLPRSYVGLELVEDGIANLCLVMQRELAVQIRPGWPALRAHLVSVSSSLEACLEAAEPLFDRPLAVVCPAGGHLDDEVAPQAYRVGDRLAHIPPFTGDGLAIAVSSGTLAAQHILDGRPPSAYRAAARALVDRPIRLAGGISALAATRVGRALIIGTATLVPAVVGSVVRRTRLSALPTQGRNVSYAPIRA